MRIERSEDVIACEIKGDIVLMTISAGEFLQLNTTAAAIWELIESPRSIEQIVDGLTQRFEIDSETASVETRELIDRLKGHAAITVSTESTTD